MDFVRRVKGVKGYMHHYELTLYFNGFAVYPGRFGFWVKIILNFAVKPSFFFLDNSMGRADLFAFAKRLKFLLTNKCNSSSAGIFQIACCKIQNLINGDIAI